MNDLRVAFRRLLKNPGFTAVAALTLAIGIGANTVVLSWIRATLLDSIPGAHRPQDLVVLVPHNHDGRITETLSHPDITDLDAEHGIFAGVTASQFGAVSLFVDGQATWVWGEMATGNFFQVLGVRPVLGRLFTPEDDRPGGGTGVAVISHRLWQQRFGGDPGIIGRAIEAEGAPVTIIGVTPPEFGGAMGGLRFDLWTPLQQHLAATRGTEALQRRDWRWLHTYARLQRGQSVAGADAAARVVSSRIEREHPDPNRKFTFAVLPLWKSPFGGQEVFLPLLRVLGLVSFLLWLLVTANLANLLLARATAREQESAVRIALGAGGARLVRQFLTESLLLACLGGLLGVVLATWGVALLLQLAPATYLPIHYDFTLQGPVLPLTLGLTLLSGILFGLAPALQAFRTDLGRVLKSAGRGADGHGTASRLRQAFVVSQVALALVLLVGMGLCLRSFQRASAMDLGLQPKGVWVAGFRLNPQTYSRVEARDFYLRLRDELARVPGVTAVGAADWLPLGFEGGSSTQVQIAGYVPSPGEIIDVGVANVSPGYFEALGIRRLTGRWFDDSDTAEQPRKAVVNEEFVRRYLAGRDPLGARIRFWGEEATIIGVVPTGRYRSLNGPPWPFLYVTLRQVPEWDMTMAVRAEGDPRTLARTVEAVAARIDPRVQPHASMRFEDYVGASFLLPRTAATLLGGLGACALVLAALGVYGVMAFSVTRRTREIGVRLALGAQPADVLRLVLRSGLRLAAWGLLFGIAAALAAGQALRSVLVGVGATDPLALVAGVSILLAAVVAACWIPARRAARVDPMEALRYE